MVMVINWYVVLFVIYDIDMQKVGGGIGLVYVFDVLVVQDVLLLVIWLDYINDFVWFMEGLFQFQLLFIVFGKFLVWLFGVVGIVMLFLGVGSVNGDIVSIVGVGVQF